MSKHGIVIERVVIPEDGGWESWMFDFTRDLVRHRGNVTKAIRANRVSRYTIYAKRNKVPEFAMCWDSIREGFRGGVGDR